MSQEIEQEVVSLGNLNSGAAIEQFDRALEQVIENIQDINTDPEEKRTIQLTVVIKPNEDRNFAEVGCKVQTKLAGIRPSHTMVYFGRRGGKRFAVEPTPAQADMFPPTVSAISKGGEA